MSIDRTIDQILEWQKKNFPVARGENWMPLVGAYEELGELSHGFLKRHQKIRTNEDHDAKIRDAVGDTVVYLIDFCRREGLDFKQVLQETWEVIAKRDWQANPETGETDDPEEKVRQDANYVVETYPHLFDKNIKVPEDKSSRAFENLREIHKSLDSPWTKIGGLPKITADSLPRDVLDNAMEMKRTIDHLREIVNSYYDDLADIKRTGEKKPPWVTG